MAQPDPSPVKDCNYPALYPQVQNLGGGYMGGYMSVSPSQLP